MFPDIYWVGIKYKNHYVDCSFSIMTFCPLLYVHPHSRGLMLVFRLLTLFGIDSVLDDPFPLFNIGSIFFLFVILFSVLLFYYFKI